MDKYDLIKKQSWTLHQKIDHSLGTIEKFYNHYQGNVYISFSGGKDSTVLLHLVRKIFPDTVGVFVNTGLEYPEIVDFVKTTPNTQILKPRKNFKDVINQYGFPIVSKKISMGIDRYRKTNSSVQKQLRLYGGINPVSGKKQHPTISKKWHHLLEAPFKISERCCDVLKKDPLKRFAQRTNLYPLIGTMAEESAFRVQEYIQHGCINYDKKIPQATPIIFWTEQDVWKYIHSHDIPYSSIYDKGYTRTGCMFCLFGIMNEDSPNRFQQMKVTHPKQHNYCINKLGLQEPLDFLNIDYE